ncbi:MAG: DNA replication/repair protein RecF [Dehalococcoidia bacterium]
MRLTRLSLANFRNYERLDLNLPSGPVLFVGENAQGKTNLLEAVYLLATTRSLRTSSDIELMRRDAQNDPLVATHVTGIAQRAGDRVEVDVAIGRRAPPGGINGSGGHTIKRMRVNGVPHRAASVVGQITAVFFTSLDIDLITGPPSGRRRHLDIMLSQVDHAYLQSLQRYTRIVQQRNSLLRQIDEGRAGSEQLGTWDDELVIYGAAIITRRHAALVTLNDQATRFHAGLSGDRERLTITYQPQLGSESREATIDLSDSNVVQTRFREALLQRRRREIASGVSLIGPHRDDIRFDLDGTPAAAFGSRAQQRTVALALRLAEGELLRAQSGDAPILLLDDILSELDEHRRTAVLETIASAEQALITTADLDRFGGDFLSRATIFSVNAGEVELLAGR